MRVLECVHGVRVGMGVLRVLGRSALAWGGETPDSCLHMSDFPLLAFVSYGRGTLRRKWQKTCLQAFLGSPVFHGSLSPGLGSSCRVHTLPPCFFWLRPFWFWAVSQS